MDRRNPSRWVYLAATLVLFAVEVVIALFVTDTFVRGYLGDVLAVMLVYTALRAVSRIGMVGALVVALGIAFVIEIAQALNLLGAIGLRDNWLARTILGGSFDPLDIAAYCTGGVIVFTLDRMSGRGGGGSRA